MARKALAWSALLATTASLPSFSLGFVAPIPAPLLGEKGTQHAAHVALHRQERRHDRRVGRRDGLPGLSSSASGVDVAGDGTKGEDEGSLWAEKRFPGCSTVLSKVRHAHRKCCLNYPCCCDSDLAGYTDEARTRLLVSYCNW